MSNAAILSDLGRLKDDLNAKLSAAAKSLQGNEEEIVELKRQNKLLIAEKDELVLNSKEEEKRLREGLQASKEAQAKLEKEKNTIREEVLQSSTHIIKQYEKTVGDQRQQLTHQGQQLELLQQQLKDATQQVTAPLSPKPGTSGQPLGARSGSREAGVKEEEASQQSALHASLLLEGSRGNGGGTTSMQAESPAEPVCAVPFVPSQGRPRGGGWVRNLKGLLVQEDRQGHGSRSPDRLTEGDKKPEKQSMKGNAPSLVDDTPDVSAGSKRRRASNDLIAEEGGEAKKGSGNAGRALPRVEQKGKQSNGDKSGNRKSGSGVQRKSSKGTGPSASLSSKMSVDLAKLLSAGKIKAGKNKIKVVFRSESLQAELTPDGKVIAEMGGEVHHFTALSSFTDKYKQHLGCNVTDQRMGWKGIHYRCDDGSWTKLLAIKTAYIDEIEASGGKLGAAPDFTAEDPEAPVVLGLEAEAVAAPETPSLDLHTLPLC